MSEPGGMPAGAGELQSLRGGVIGLSRGAVRSLIVTLDGRIAAATREAHELGRRVAELEVVGEGGSMPTPAMLAWARELQVGGWYMLDYRNRNDQVQLAWQGMRKQLTLFVSPHGRGILFQRHRLAAFLQAGLLVPAQDESLTTRATRNALAKLDVDPQRLLN